MFQDLDDFKEFQDKCQELTTDYSNCSLVQRVNYKGFLTLLEELTEYLMIPSSLIKMKASFIINWQQTTDRQTNFVQKRRTTLLPKFVTTIKSPTNYPNYPFSIDRALTSVPNECSNEYQRLVILREMIKKQEIIVKDLLKQRESIQIDTAKKYINLANRKEMDQAERRYLRLVSDFMFLIDNINRDLNSRCKKKSYSLQ